MTDDICECPKCGRQHRNLGFGKPPHKIMTPEEYAALPLKGWHEVCRDVDGFGGVGVRYLGGKPPKSIMEQIAHDIREGTFPKKSETTLTEELDAVMWRCQEAGRCLHGDACVCPGNPR